jgi:hypothetical protein
MAAPFESNADQRRTVRAMAGFGVPQNDIARHLEIDPKTLRLHFRRELDGGMTEANTKVAQSLFNMATQQNNVAAAIFWMKARCGWREKQVMEVTGHDDGPLEVVVDDVRARLVERIARLARAGNLRPELQLLGSHDDNAV